MKHLENIVEQAKKVMQEISIIDYSKVAEGYQNLTKAVLKIEKQREKCKAGFGRLLVYHR